MSTYFMVVLRDIRANIHSDIKMWHKTEQAIREFEDRQVSDDKKDLVAMHPEDFELIVIGEYEDHTGTILEYKGADRAQLAIGQKRKVRYLNPDEIEKAAFPYHER